jgi:uncharacterized protein (TIGR02302 family)
MSALKRRIAVKRWAAYSAIVFERLTVGLLPAIGVVSVTMILGWSGLARIAPVWVKIAAIPVVFALLVLALARLRLVRMPDMGEADRRIEHTSELSHQAISIQSDKSASDDPYALALWKLHQTRMAASIKAIDSGPPAPDFVGADPYVLRAVVALLLVASWSFSYSNSGGRLTDIFDFSSPGTLPVGMRIDAWVTPPSYTGKAPVYLSNVGQSLSGGSFTVPQFSELTVRVSGTESNTEISFAPADGSKSILLTANDAASPAAARKTEKGATYRLKLFHSGTAAINGIAYRFALIPDKPPMIHFAKEPDRAAIGALEITYAATDDYGVTDARAEIVPADKDPAAQPLFDLPKYSLDIPGGDHRAIRSTVSRDLTEHPLSGKKVLVTLYARDAEGQEGHSETKEIVLPERFFSIPLAGSIAEQRQVFALDQRQIDRALELNEAAATRADETIPEIGNFLLLQSVRNRLTLSQDKDLTKTADYFWQVARYIEDGDLSDAEKRLKAAQDKLSDALKRNASDKEISELMKELRQAMKDYLNEMAKRMQNPDPNQLAQQNQKMIRSQDLEKMLDQLENLARSGSKDEARQLLSEMQRMMNNIQTARPDQNQQQNPVRKQIDKLGELMQNQEKLMDETHKLEQALRDRMQQGDLNDKSEDGLSPDQNQDPQALQDPDQQQDPGAGQDQKDQAGKDQPPAKDGQKQAQTDKNGKPLDKMSEDELRNALKDLKSRQQQLEKDLDALKKGIAELGLKAPPGFKDAGKEMGGSSDALGKGLGQRSADAQGRALDALRNGAGDLMQQLKQAGRDGGQQGVLPGGEQTTGNDPLGRQTDRNGEDIDGQVKVPDQIDVQRAREILDAIRRKLGDGPASILEKNYLERLLEMQ